MSESVHNQTTVTLNEGIKQVSNKSTPWSLSFYQVWKNVCVYSNTGHARRLFFLTKAHKEIYLLDYVPNETKRMTITRSRIYPLNSKGREILSNNWTGGKPQSVGSFLRTVVLCFWMESFLDKCTSIFCSFLLQSISCLAHCTISITVSMQFPFCGCLWHKSSTSTAETLMSVISMAWITLLLEVKNYGLFFSLPI